MPRRGQSHTATRVLQKGARREERGGTQSSAEKESSDPLVEGRVP
jgi:hypothetical protein